MSHRKLEWYAVTLLAMCVLGLLTPGLPAQAALRWKFKEGQVLTQHMEMKTTSKAAFGGDEQTSTNTMKMESSWKTKSIAADGKADIESKVERVQLNMDLPGGEKLEYDSSTDKEIEGPIGAMIGPAMKALMAGTTKFQMTPQGKLENMLLPKELLDAVKRMPGGAEAAGPLSDESLKQLIESFPPLPEGDLAPGQTWKGNQKVTMPFGVMHMDNKYTYEGKEKREGREAHRIGQKTNVSLVKKEGGPPFEIKLKPNEASGVLYFDEAVGRFTGGQQTQSLVMEVQTPGNAAAPSFELKTETVTSWRLEEAKDPGKKAEPVKKAGASPAGTPGKGANLDPVKSAK